MERAAELDPAQPRIHQFLGRLYQRQDRRALAVAAFLRAVALNPEDVDLLCDLAAAYTFLGDFAAAEDLVRRAHALDPANPRVAELIDALEMKQP
jgi:Flp pilus assembly protein TadD